MFGASRRAFSSALQERLARLKESGEYKLERVITSTQSRVVTTDDNEQLLNFCANNYLGLADHPALEQAASQALHHRGYGMASVRFICGTQQEHKQLERAIADFYQTEDAILYSSCFDANTGLFETLLGEQDAIISDSLNHASIVDGIRLCKAKRVRYANNDMASLEEQLQQTQDARFLMIATDSVFSMDGVIADLGSVCDLADKYDALVMVDESHAMGVIGDTGRGAVEYCGVIGRPTVITGTLGKALGGASGGFTAGDANAIEWLRQHSRPYLFSNALAPIIASTTLMVMEYLEQEGARLRSALAANAGYFRSSLSSLGFRLAGKDHPIIPVMVGEAQLAQQMAARLGELGVYVTGFCYPVVPKGQARVRTQISAAHSREDIGYAIDAFATAGKELGLIASSG